MTYRPIAEYLPHRPPMVLLDRIVEVAEAHVVCEVALKVDSPFCDGAAVPGWVGIEYMAQTVGVLAGWRALEKGLPVRIGFLVGTRHYRCHAPQFRAGSVLRITADEELSSDGGVVAMRCAVRDADAAADAVLAEAALLVFQPDDLEAYLRQISVSRAGVQA
ncbi:MAG: 3-hydroxylacyl-ACP dehydratase [Burkholderiales bacterium]|jgi:predicted hotdog family 3-hydroxylacyl-ACP dehydratase|nr:3-hydroxylacyl-ACP dehydratase [Burkholderiales bacterium]